MSTESRRAGRTVIAAYNLDANVVLLLDAGLEP